MLEIVPGHANAITTASQVRLYSDAITGPDLGQGELISSEYRWLVASVIHFSGHMASCAPNGVSDFPFSRARLIN